MDAVKARIRCGKTLDRGLDVSLNLGLLAVVTSSGPVGDVSFHVRPDIPLSYQVTRSFNARVGQ